MHSTNLNIAYLSISQLKGIICSGVQIPTNSGQMCGPTLLAGCRLSLLQKNGYYLLTSHRAIFTQNSQLSHYLTTMILLQSLNPSASFP